MAEAATVATIDPEEFEVSIMNEDYRVVVHQGNDVFRPKTLFYDDGELLFELHGTFYKEGAACVLKGYRRGIDAGKQIGEDAAKAAMRQLLGVPSLRDISVLDSRLERVERKVS